MTIVHEEIYQQPKVLQRLLATKWDAVQHVADAIRARQIDYVYLAGRGTSEHAGTYGQYIFGAFNQLPVALAAPSLFTIYHRPPRLERALVIGISQSGQSPDIVGVVAEARRQGALTLAITNDINSPLASGAELALDIGAGVERAVAATKTYTAQLLILSMLSVALEGSAERLAALQQLPAAIEQALLLDNEIARIAGEYRDIEQCVVLGRGYNFATALEWALKLKELTYVVAERYSTAEFRHGPIALVEPGFPVLAVAPYDAGFADTTTLLTALAREHGARLLVVSNDEPLLATAEHALRLPSDLPTWLTPLVAIVPGQLFCYHLALARGYDPAMPRGLRKVTKTR